MVQTNSLDALRNGKAKIWSLFVGVNHYQDTSLHDLNYAAQDCQALADALSEATAQFPHRSEGFVHHDNTVDTPPTLSVIRQSLNTIAEATKPQDTLLFHFSGHGKVASSNQLYLCLASTRLNDLSGTALSVEELLQILKLSRASNIVVVFDACRNGDVAVTRGTGTAVLSRSTNPSADTGEGGASFISQLQTVLDDYQPGRKEFCVLYSCMDGQESWELSGNIQHGAFSYCLIRGLKGEAAGDRESITIDRLFEFVRDETETLVRSWNKSQTPGCKREPRHRDIILGMRSPNTPKPLSKDAPIRERKNWYHDEYERLVRYQGIYIDEMALQRLRDESTLDPETIQQIEVDINRNYHPPLLAYQRILTEQIQHHGIPNDQKLMQLRESLGVNRRGFDETVFKRIENQVIEPFIQQYRQFYTQVLRTHGLPLTSNVNKSLLQRQVDLNLDHTTARRIADEEIRRFQQDEQTLQQFISDTLHQFGEISSDVLETQNQMFQFGSRLLEAIVQHQLQRFRTDLDAYAQLISDYLHEYGELNHDDLTNP